MPILAYYLLHVGSVILLTALTFQAFAAPDPARRKRTMMLTGILALVAAVGGFGLLAKLQLPFAGWVIVKLVCWLVLAALSGIAFKKPKSGGTLALVATIVVLTALYMVYGRPF